LENAEAVLAVGDEANALAATCDFYIVDVIELASAVKIRSSLGASGFSTINDRESLLPCRDVSVSAGNIDVAGIFEGDERVGDELWLREIRTRELSKAARIDRTKAYRNCTAMRGGITESGRADVGGNARARRNCPRSTTTRLCP